MACLTHGALIAKLNAPLAIAQAAAEIAQAAAETRQERHGAAERLGETYMFFRAECFASLQKLTEEQHAFPKRLRKCGAEIDGSKARATDRVAPALSLRQLQFGGTSIFAVRTACCAAQVLQ